MTHPIAVFDIGKTNAKLLVFAPTGAVLHARRTNATWRVTAGLAVLDEAALLAWIMDALAEVTATHGVRGVMFATHGCTFALLDADGLAAPILDYEQAVPAAVEAEYERIRPSFAETGAPRMPRGFALAKHIVWRELRDPALARRVTHILTYPQFWAWRLCGARVGEVSSLGCHSHLWSPGRNNYSSLVDRRDWRRRMPPLRAAGEIVGGMTIDLPSGGSAEVAIHNGVHDSNASLDHYRRLVPGRMALVSTGTWCVVINPSCQPSALVPERDMLINVTIGREPVPTARFMGGREFDILRGCETAEPDPARIERMINRGILALPAFADGGPFPAALGCIADAAGEPVTPEAGDRAALAVLYIALMIDITLELVRSRDVVVLDGGLTRHRVIARLLAALRPLQPVLLGAHAEGTASGAAGIAFRGLGLEAFGNETLTPAAPFHAAGLARYAANWRRLAAGGNRTARAAPCDRPPPEPRDGQEVQPTRH